MLNFEQRNVKNINIMKNQPQ